MKTIGIDLNDVVRKYSEQYTYYYNKALINKEFNPDKVKYKEGDMYSPFEFPSKKAKEDFETVDYVFEIFACAKPTHTSLPGNYNIWLNDLLDEFENEIEVWYISPGETHLQRQSTLSFLAKICSRVERIWFPPTIAKMWNEIDILVTANPQLLKSVPEGKTTIKIKTKYNKKSDSTYSYDNFMDFISEKNYDKIKTLLKSE
jgi:hypothetical protein